MSYFLGGMTVVVTLSSSTIGLVFALSPSSCFHCHLQRVLTVLVELCRPYQACCTAIGDVLNPRVLPQSSPRRG
ncbi:hypothetical protein V6N12_065698 [Hibiscus sabdariffa]|uniref:Secreted protein n=1 Tax=Hibiscus sabdariffa TaxID=183260 RepID=A0ABR2G9G5_9ROSI